MFQSLCFVIIFFNSPKNITGSALSKSVDNVIDQGDRLTDWRIIRGMLVRQRNGLIKLAI